ncbi:hypothetical protein NHQ30_011171 [Ciborinia camelliae]|nr:hypothetical protein NHQ30_011171 [Ciborinia camelliae]
MSEPRNGGNASRPTGENRSNMAPSIVIDLTEDSDKDKKRNAKSNKKVKEKIDKGFIDLSMTSDDEPSAPAKAPGPAKSLFKAKTLAKPPEKVPNYQNGGTYSLLSESESDDEPPMKVSESASKENRANSRNDNTTRRSPSRKSNGMEMASSVPLVQLTARKTGSISHRKSNSGSVGKASAPSSARSTPGPPKGHGMLLKSGCLNLSHAMAQQSSSKSTASSTSNFTQPNPSTTKVNDTQMRPVASTLESRSTNDTTNDTSTRKEAASNIHSTYLESEKVATPRLPRPSSPEIEESPLSAKNAPLMILGGPTQVNNGGLNGQDDNKTCIKPDLQKKKKSLQESCIERQSGYPESTAMEGKNENSSIRKEILQNTLNILERTVDHYEPAKENNGSSDKDNNSENDNGIDKTLGRNSQPVGNEGSNHAESCITNGEFLSVADIPKAPTVPYQKKLGHGGARRGPAWEKQKYQKERVTEGRSAADEASDDDDDIQPIPQRKRKRGQDQNKHLVSGPSSTRSASHPPKRSEEERHGRRCEGRIGPISNENSLTPDGSFKMASQELSMNEIKESVAQLEETMMKDCGLSVKSLLEKRRLCSQAALNIDSWDDESPFASMKAPDENTEEAIKLNARTTRKGRTPTYVAPIIVGDGGVKRTPSYTHHTNVIRNHLTGDDEKFRYYPLVGTSDAIQNEEKAMSKLEKDLNAAYVQGNEDPREREQISQIDRHIDLYLEGVGYDNCDRTALIRYFLGNRRQYHTSEKRLVLKTLGGPLSGELYQTMEKIVLELTKAFKINLENVVLSKSRFKDLVESAKAQSYKQSGDQPSSPERLETVAQFLCLICFGAACTTHGEYSHRKINKDVPSDTSSELDPLDRSFEKPDYEYVWEKFIMHCPDVMRKHNARDHSKRNENWHPEDWNTEKDTTNACGDDCYRTKTMTSYVWTQGEETELKKILLAAKPDKPCSLVDIIDKPCWQIYSKILDLDHETPVTRSQSLPNKQKCEPAEWYDPRVLPKNRRLKPGWQDDTAAHIHDQRSQPVPCVHEGPCRRDMNCSCVINNLLCEQFCGCTDKCGRRFTGCSCHADGLACASDTCICFQMNRECGDQCDSCGAIPRIRPQNRHKDELFQNGCQNIALQRGVTKKLVLGDSQLEGVGYGLFAAEPVKKGEFLSEYAGEVISDNEAERRGLIYERKYMSFLFDLNQDMIVDAAHMGNKTRFINHAETEADGLNCIAKILLVNGEHRIAFRASRDIKIGDELFFNYGKKFADIQGLNKRIGDGKSKMPKANKGVVTGETGLAVLDGLGGKKGARRRKVREMVEALEDEVSTKKKRGWQKGRSRGKASKKAKVRDYDIAGPSRGHTDQDDEENADADGDGNGDDMMMDVDAYLHPNIIPDSDVEDETFIGKSSSDVEMGEAEDELEGEGEGARRTKRMRRVPARYTR